jgi:hypothetical protein
MFRIRHWQHATSQSTGRPDDAESPGETRRQGLMRFRSVTSASPLAAALLMTVWLRSPAQILRVSRIRPLKHAFADFYSTTFAQAATDNGQYGRSVLMFFRFSQAGRSIAPRRARSVGERPSRGELRPVWPADRWAMAQPTPSAEDRFLALLAHSQGRS